MSDERRTSSDYDSAEDAPGEFIRTSRSVPAAVVPAPRSRLKFFIILVFLFGLVPFAAIFLSGIYSKYVEYTPPTIEVLDAPRGIGLAPVSLHVRFRDLDSGLDAAVVRIKQRGAAREIKRVTFDGRREAELELSFEGEKAELLEGTAVITFKAFDRSFWSNAQEESLELRVDYHKPKVEVVSTQHNARLGGSQLLFYRAYDEDLGISGVKVGNAIFRGFPAGGLDGDLKQSNLYAAIYAIPLDFDSARDVIKVFAEDNSGNSAFSGFYNRVAPRPSRPTPARVGDEFVREKVAVIARENAARIGELRGGSERNRGADATAADYRRAFSDVNDLLRRADDAQISRLLANAARAEAYWQGPFARPQMTIQSGFGDTLKYVYLSTNEEIGEWRQIGMEFLPSQSGREVPAAGNGVVAFVETFPVYGRTVAIDHGLGLVTLYSQLGSATVARGDSVRKGQTVGVGGGSGLSRNGALRVEFRLQGTPVDPQEWLDGGWFFSHIVGKANEVKQSMGIPAYVPLAR
jgi:murein DD-endopeptidase MepM/ murein hydrolase activator NlpD